MIFTVDVEKKVIKCRNPKISTPIPEDQLDWWNSLNEKTRQSVYDSTKEITLMNYNSKEGHVEFGYSVEVKPNELENQDDPEILKFVCCFYLDLSDYSLKSATGIPLKPELINKDLRHLNIFNQTGDSYWLKSFYQYWRRLAYPVGSRKTAASYMFSLSKGALSHLKVAEKISRTGWDPIEILPQGKLNPIDLNLKPWEFLAIPKQVYNYIAKDRALQQCFYYRSRISTLRSFKHWNEVWTPLEQLNLIPAFLILLSEGDSWRMNRFTEDFEELITDRNYNTKRLLEYLFKDLPEKQGFCDIVSATSVLSDYASMSYAVYDHVEDKYPVALKTAHDIIVAKFNKIKHILEDAKIMKIYDTATNYAYTCISPEAQCIVEGFGKAPLRIEVPRTSSDIVDEGREMHHCVATYVPKIIAGSSLILFMRTRSHGSISGGMKRHLTIELQGNVIAQARGNSNRNPDATEFAGLIEWANAKSLDFCSDLRNIYEQVVGLEFPTLEIEKELKKLKEKVNAK